MDLYQEEILHHYKNPKNHGRLENPTISVSEANNSCGDVIHIDLLIDKKGTISDTKFVGVGCAISQACASMLTEKIKGTDCAKVVQISNKDIFEMLGVPISTGRIKCALLPLVAVKKACTAAPMKQKKQKK